MKQPAKPALIGFLSWAFFVMVFRALTFGALAFGALAATAQPNADDSTAELREQVDRLFDSVLDEDAAGIDEITCLDDLLHAQLHREAALDLVADPTDPVLVEDRTSAARTAVNAFAMRLFLNGGQVESVDVSRLEIFDPGASEEGEMLVGEGEAELAITASGVLGVKMEGLPREVDLGVYRLGDRWCLDPLSMQ